MASKISVQEVQICQALRRAGEWLTAEQVAKEVGCTTRCVRSHCERLQARGLVRVSQVSPGHRYRWHKESEGAQEGYLGTLAEAAEALGLATTDGG